MAGEKRIEGNGRPPVGRLLYVKTAVVVTCGPKQCNPNARAHVDEGWSLIRDENGYWLGYGTKGPGMVAAQMHWSHVPFDSVQFAAYAPAETGE